MMREDPIRCSTCGQFGRHGDLVYLADEDGQPIYGDDGEMHLECQTCQEKRPTVMSDA